MKVLQFAFSSDSNNEHLPHNYDQNCVAYTGTHDNNTTLGWLRSLSGKERKMAGKYLGFRKKRALRAAIAEVWGSVAKTAVVPMQDLVGQGKDGRMNTPGTPWGNWGWRFSWKQLKTSHHNFLKELTEKYNR